MWMCPMTYCSCQYPLQQRVEEAAVSAWVLIQYFLFPHFTLGDEAFSTAAIKECLELFLG